MPDVICKIPHPQYTDPAKEEGEVLPVFQDQVNHYNSTAFSFQCFVVLSIHTVAVIVHVCMYTYHQPEITRAKEKDLKVKGPV